MPGYRLIQFSSHPVYAAPINVGVLVWDGQDTYLRMLGTDGDMPFRTNLYRHLSISQPMVDEVLHEWASWFRVLASDPRRLSEEAQHDLDKLNESGSPFSCANHGKIDCEQEDLSLVAEDLFQKCVLSNSTVRRLVLQDRLLQILEEVELAGLADTVMDAELELVPKKGLGTGLLFFPWFYQGDKVKAAIKLVDFDQDAVMVVQQVSEAMGAFDSKRSINHALFC